MSHVFGFIVNVWWGGIAIAAIRTISDALVHIGNGLVARAQVENAKLKAGK